MFGTVFDTEGNGLTPDKFHVLSIHGSESTNDYDKMRKFLLETPILVGHNICRWDIPNLERVLEIEIPKETLLVDTLALCWYLYPKEKKNGLADWGERYGIKKPEVEDWDNLTYEEYKYRCEEDVKINHRLWRDQYEYLIRIYGTEEKVKAFLRYLQFKLYCARLQEESRWLLDTTLCRDTIVKLEFLKEEKVNELRGLLPKVPIVSTRRRPKVLYKSNGEHSELGRKWFQLLDSRGLDHGSTEAVEVITGYDEPNPNSHEQIKDYLFSLGWVPRTFKENKKGVEVPQINKSKQDGGGVCDSIKDLYEKEPRLDALDGLFVLSHRLGILHGFLQSVDKDGYVTARIHGLTNTLRFKHTEIVNLPKVDAPYGAEVRGCLKAPEGFELCGSDMSSLEDRTKQHYMWDYDPEYVKEMMTPDFDPHLDIAVFDGGITKKQSDDYKNGVYTPIIKTLRGIYKNVNYSCTYGAGPPKIAKTGGLELSKAQSLHKAYWARNWSIKEIAKNCITKVVNGQAWLFNPVSEFWYSLRNDKDKFSTLNQGTGVYCFDVWVGCVLRRRRQLTAQFHDEIVLCIKQGFREETKAFLQECIQETNDILQLNRQLDIGIEFGNCYADIH